MLTPIIDKAVVMRSLSSLFALANREGDTAVGGVVGSSLTIILQLDRTTVRYASMRTVQIKYILQNCCSEKSAFLTYFS